MTTTKLSYDAAARDCDAIDEAERLGWTGERCSLSAAGWYRIIDEDDGLEGVMLDNFRKDVADALAWLEANRPPKPRRYCFCGAPGVEYPAALPGYPDHVSVLCDYHASN